MDSLRMLSDAFDYTKEALWGRWVRWLLLIVSTILFPFICGYTVRVMSGAKPAPELKGWIGLFVDGIKLLVITVIYAIPIWVIALVGFVAYFIPVSATTTPGPGSGSGLGPEAGIFVAIALFVVFIVLAVVVGILSTFAMVRFARTGRVGEAFRFGALLSHIGRVGWLDVFIALLILGIVVAVAQFILLLIPVLGVPLLFILMPAFIIFTYRYIALVYESAPASA
ncbi:MULTISPECIES: DUF4013 domain-containing protein [unclassified Methanoculleus]|uniref:DUF4013 domain-containing protein n=1 Tax=unclassified Methanoculleus TaxID=2619537 RepID=UPI0025FF0291|nr:DUF4013 domain-containing protein [Methanoculleus sp. UBA377]